MHNLQALYDGKKVYPNLYLFVAANASAGKGRLTHCKQLVQPIHQTLRKQTQKAQDTYQKQLQKFAKSKNEDLRPKRPPEKMLFIPANTSTTGVFQLLADNQGVGLMFETEGDTLAQTFKSDYGNYSDGFRKAFHHESISYFRRMDREYVDISLPRLSVLLSGSPKQVATLIPDVENGLFSRFMFYYMDVNLEWKNVFENKVVQGLDTYYSQLGEVWLKKYQILQTHTQITFCLDKQQQNYFHNYFKNSHNKFKEICGHEYLASVRRLGLTTYRLAMVLTLIRNLDQNKLQNKLTCNNQDFQLALSMVEVLIEHTYQVFLLLSQKQNYKLSDRYQTFVEDLPQSFNTQTYLQIAAQLSIPKSTAQRYISRAIQNKTINRMARDVYQKPS